MLFMLFKKWLCIIRGNVMIDRLSLSPAFFLRTMPQYPVAVGSDEERQNEGNNRGSLSLLGRTNYKQSFLDEA